MFLHSRVQSHLREEQNRVKLEDKETRKHSFHNQSTLNADSMLSSASDHLEQPIR